MTTPIPQFKFFDTEKKAFLENQEEYFINYLGEIFEKEYDTPVGYFLTRTKNIIAVPFTGFFDRNKKPIYKSDILKVTYFREESVVGVVDMVINYRIYRFYVNNNHLINNRDTYENIWEINNLSEIIGSALTHPELLDEK